MSLDTVPALTNREYALSYADEKEFVTMRVGGQLLGISVLAVQDVLRPQPSARVPLAPKVIAGLLNIRGRIVTAIDMRERLGLKPQSTDEQPMYVVVEYHNELYSLVVDVVGDVHNLPMSEFEKAPVNLGETWKEIAAGVFKMKGELLVVMDVESVLGSLVKN